MTKSTLRLRPARPAGARRRGRGRRPLTRGQQAPHLGQRAAWSATPGEVRELARVRFVVVQLLAPVRPFRVAPPRGAEAPPDLPGRAGHRGEGGALHGGDGILEERRQAPSIEAGDRRETAQGQERRVHVDGFDHGCGRDARPVQGRRGHDQGHVEGVVEEDVGPGQQAMRAAIDARIAHHHHHRVGPSLGAVEGVGEEAELGVDGRGLGGESRRAALPLLGGEGPRPHQASRSGEAVQGRESDAGKRGEGRGGCGPRLSVVGRRRWAFVGPKAHGQEERPASGLGQDVDRAARDGGGGRVLGPVPVELGLQRLGVCGTDASREIALGLELLVEGSRPFRQLVSLSENAGPFRPQAGKQGESGGAACGGCGVGVLEAPAVGRDPIERRAARGRSPVPLRSSHRRRAQALDDHQDDVSRGGCGNGAPCVRRHEAEQQPDDRGFEQPARRGSRARGIHRRAAL